MDSDYFFGLTFFKIKKNPIENSMVIKPAK